MLTQLLYVSQHNGIMDGLPEFIQTMREKNKEFGLSSILLSTDECYLHLLEGSRTNVNRLYNRIVKDPRHFNCTVVRYIDVKKREFDNWYAEHVSIREFDIGDINLLLPSGGNISAEEISSAQAVTIVRRIHAHLQVKSSNLG